MRCQQVLFSSRFIECAVMAAAIVLGMAVNMSASAHNVVSVVYADGMTIEGEVGFSNGDMATAGVVVDVLNEAGDKLGETTLLEGGTFVYQATVLQKYVFKADLSSGHIASMVIEADELSADIPSSASNSSDLVSKGLMTASTEPVNDRATDISNAVTESADTIATGVTVAELQVMIRSTVAQQVRPLQKELSAYKEKVMFRDIAGGLGFIFGVFGVAAWVASKRKDEGKDN